MGSKEECEQIDLKHFQLVFYTSFASQEDAIAYELIASLKQLCEKHNYKNLFKHVSRISKASGTLVQSKPPRWDQNYFTNEMCKYTTANNFKKAWMCGPPLMQENFDKATEDIQRNKIHLL